jgi:cytochrome c556
MLEKRLLSLIMAFLLSTIAHAETDTDPDLKQIMQTLLDDSVLILNGLLVDDFDSVAAAAARVADHPEIPAKQIALVAAELAEEMVAFKQYDTLVHDLSLAIRSAAHENNRSRAIADYQQMINSCLACHFSYRQRVADALSAEAAGT